MKVKGKIPRDNKSHCYCPECWCESISPYEHEGKEYLTLKREINLAGLVVQKDGDSRVFVREYDPNPVEKEDLPF